MDYRFENKTDLPSSMLYLPSGIGTACLLAMLRNFTIIWSGLTTWVFFTQYTLRSHGCDIITYTSQQSACVCMYKRMNGKIYSKPFP